jgi:hypothetical protein
MRIIPKLFLHGQGSPLIVFAVFFHRKWAKNFISSDDLIYKIGNLFQIFVVKK